jgi:hypothetical protein
VLFPREAVEDERSGGGRDAGHGGEGSGSSDFRHHHDAKDQEQEPRRSQEDDQTKLNRILWEEEAILRNIPKRKGRMSKAGASFLRLLKDGSKK